MLALGIVLRLVGNIIIPSAFIGFLACLFTHRPVLDRISAAGKIAILLYRTFYFLRKYFSGKTRCECKGQNEEAKYPPPYAFCFGS